MNGISSNNEAPLLFSFDIGHSSIGWGVIKSDGNPWHDPEVLDAGVVLFPKDSCLASRRRAHRRTRRNIRSRRQRIERIRRLLVYKRIITEDESMQEGHMAPYFLAARALRDKQVLTGVELWHVLRWYAHNRGYDGNSRWAKEAEQTEDTQKLKNAHALMIQYGTASMCETICSMLDLDTDKENAGLKKDSPAYKIANAAFSRQIVEEEVNSILKKHNKIIPELDDETSLLISSTENLTKEQRAVLSEAKIVKLPLRYFGGLLFGQLIPRFDNRIITRCPITWAQVYESAISEGKSENEAKREADKKAKVPLASSREFLRYRLARVIANLRANGEPLRKELRRELFVKAEERGGLTPTFIKAAIKASMGDGVEDNVSNYFELHPDSDKSLVLDPALDYARKAQEVKKNKLYPYFSLFPEELKKYCISIWRKGKSITLSECLQKMEKFGEDTKTLRFKMESALSDKKKRTETWDQLITLAYSPDKKTMTGRAPYTRSVLEQVVKEILDGYDPTRPALSENHPEGEVKEKDGILYALVDPSSHVNKLRESRGIDELTNNHLVRHRLVILERLLKEMVQEYTQGNTCKVEKIVVEMGREVSEMSGKTAKEIASELNNKLKDFKDAVRYMEKNATDLKLTGGLIRKARIAMDMGWKCPFTKQEYSPYQLQDMEKEHIIPYASRKTNALSALVLTWPEVNKMKGKRTAMQFIEECGGQPVEGKTNLSLLTPKQYKEFVEGLSTKGHKEDEIRKKTRKKLMLVSSLEDKNEDALGFTAGHLTQSSHLMKLAASTMKVLLPDASILYVPGRINAEIRKAWKTLECMVAVSPDIVDEDKKMRTKEEIRAITHMHHALDALNLGLAAHYFPNIQNGKLWETLLKRKKTKEDKEALRIYKLLSVNEEGSSLLADIPKHIKEQMTRCLSRERVMQHIPSDRSGSLTKETTWRIVKINGGEGDAMVHVRQRTLAIEGNKRKRGWKTDKLKAQKMLGALPKGKSSKLGKIKGGIEIDGNYGVALDPEPKVILHHKVQEQMDEIKRRNGGKMPRIIRPYSLIKLSGQGKRDGIWIVRVISNGSKYVMVDLTRPSMVKGKGKHDRIWLNVIIQSLLKKGVEIIDESYLGIPRE